MGWFIVAVLVVAVVVALVRYQRTDVPPIASTDHTRPPAYTAPKATGPPSTRGPTTPAYEPDPWRGRDNADRMPFAEAGMRGTMFNYAGPVTSTCGYLHDGPYAVVDVETTGLSPRRGDRVVEIAIAIVDSDGTVLDEWATLVNPGRDTGPSFIHGISNADVASAPTFAQITPEILARINGKVLVAHNAPFEEAFLESELRRAGINGLQLPALCTLWMGRRTFSTPNYKLTTLAAHAGVPLIDKHAALGDVRAVSALLPLMFDTWGRPVGYPCPPLAAGPLADSEQPIPRLVTRAVALRRGTDGWMHSLMARLPMSADEAEDTVVESYLEALADVMADGKILGEEAKQLAAIAGAAGLGRAQVSALNERFLESMREAAYADDVLDASELRQLTAAAKALGAPSYFDDLTPTSGPPGKRTPVAAPSTVACSAADVGARQVRRCGHCRRPGHYRRTCPDLVPGS